MCTEGLLTTVKGNVLVHQVGEVGAFLSVAHLYLLPCHLAQLYLKDHICGVPIHNGESDQLHGQVQQDEDEAEAEHLPLARAESVLIISYQFAEAFGKPDRKSE